MAGEWSEYLKDSVGYDLSLKKYSFNGRFYRRHGQAVKAAFRHWREIKND